MGRQLRRVALDFNWPQDTVWKGFINPHYDKQHDCEACNHSGYSPQAYHLYQQWYGYVHFNPESRGSRPWTPEDAPVKAFAERNVGRSPNFYGSSDAAIEREALRLSNHFNRSMSHHLNQEDVDALVEAGRLVDFTHTWTRGEGWKPKIPAYHPTAAEVNAWSLQGMGHDSINQGVVVRAACVRAGHPVDCEHCAGEGVIWDSPEAKQLAETWEEEQPPSGPGYQLWETVTEGSPISPVFERPEDLARWLVHNPAGIDEGTTFEQWMAFICGDGWAPSLVMGDGQVMSGVVAQHE